MTASVIIETNLSRDVINEERLVVMLAGHPRLRQPPSDAQEPSPPPAAQPWVGTGCPIFKRVPKRKRTMFVEAGTAVSPRSSIQAHNDSEQGIYHQQAAAAPTASVRINVAQEPGNLGPPRAVEVNAVQQTSPHTARETQAATAEAKERADVLQHVDPADRSRPGPQQEHRETPARAVSTRVQHTEAGLPALPEAPPASFVLPPPEKEFLLLRRTLMPAYEAKPASAPGIQLEEGVCTDEDEEEIDIMAVSPRAEQPSSQYEPDQARQRAQSQQRSEPAEQPSQDLASHADAHCAVTWQPLQVGAPEALEGAQRQGVKDPAQGQSCRQAVIAGEQLVCVQDVAGGVREPTQEGCTAASASRQGVAAAEGAEAAEAVGAAGAQSGEHSIVRKPGQHSTSLPTSATGLGSCLSGHCTREGMLCSYAWPPMHYQTHPLEGWIDMQNKKGKGTPPRRAQQLCQQLSQPQHPIAAQTPCLPLATVGFRKMRRP